MQYLLRNYENDISSLKSQFLDQVLSKKYFESLKTSSELLNTNPYYSLVSYILINDQTKILEFVTNNKIEIDLVLYLTKCGLCIPYTVDHLNKIKIRDYLYYLCIKELLIKNIIEYDPDALLDKIGDFDVYRWCIKNKKDLRKRDTINYEYYLVHKKNFECLEGLLEKVKMYKDIEYLVNISGLTSHKNVLVNYIVRYINRGYNREVSKDIKNLLEASESNLEYVKLYLAYLISSRDLNNLVLALYISKKYSFTNLENYEIDLIYLFLLKYFLFYDDVVDVYRKLDIKNNQDLNMSYIWSDVYINLINKKDKFFNVDTMKMKYLMYIKNTKKSIEDNLCVFIECNKISYAINLIKLYEEINTNVVYKELQDEKFIEGRVDTQFSDLLGSRCRYLFNKNVKNYKIEMSNEIFKNENYSEEFKEWFIKNMKIYN
jgi:hypothetical protein